MRITKYRDTGPKAPSGKCYIDRIEPGMSGGVIIRFRKSLRTGAPLHRLSIFQPELERFVEVANKGETK